MRRVKVQEVRVRHTPRADDAGRIDRDGHIPPPPGRRLAALHCYYNTGLGTEVANTGTHY